ncbi:MAG: chalcone isomerase family protein [Methyloligellaceae bacterium]
MSTTANAATCAGIEMPDEIRRGGKTLVLNGMGLRLARFLAFQAKVYAAGLYLPKRSPNASSIINVDQPRIIALYFLRDVNEQRIRRSMQQSFERNAGNRIDRLRNQIAEFQNAIPDLKAGQLLIFSYLPDNGTTVTLEGTKKAVIKGAEFASALFSLWLGNPPNQELKVGLLGGAC